MGLRLRKKVEVISMSTEKIDKNVQSNSSARDSFLTQPLGSLIAKNAFPAVISMLFMAMYQVVDASLVGRRLGPEALASVNILYPVLSLFIGLAVMVGVGGNSKIAVLLGKGNSKKASSLLSLIIIIGSSVGFTGTLLSIIFFPRILSLLGTSGNLGVLAGQYFKAMYPFFAFMVLLFILEQSVRNDGKANLAMGVMIGTALLNIVLDYVFLYPLDRGIAGAALATGISQTIGALVFLTYFVLKTISKRLEVDVNFGLTLSSPRGTLVDIKGIILNGSSEFFNSIAMGITTFLYNRLLMHHIGSMGVAAFALAQYMLMFGSMIFIGLSGGAQPIISYNHGAKLNLRVKKTIYYTMSTAVLIALVFFILFNWKTESLVGLFISAQDDTIYLASTAVQIMSWSILFMPFGVLGSMFFTALERPKESFSIALCRGLVLTVVGLIVFPIMLGDTGIWITPIFTEAITTLIVIFLIKKWSKVSKGEKLLN